jgi:RimJ/RimL family protein N-acetyltransferase
MLGDTMTMTMTMPTLTGPRVTLRALQPEDEQARLSLGWQATIEYNYGRHVQTREMTPAEARAWYEQQQARTADPSGCHWVIEAEGHLVGVTRLHDLKETDRKAHFAAVLSLRPVRQHDEVSVGSSAGSPTGS